MAKRTIRKVSGARLLHANGSMVFCENCEKVVGSINQMSYKYINLIFLCTCGNCGRIEISRGKNKNDISVQLNKMPSIRRKGVCCCTKCDTPLFSTVENALQNYFFFVECNCGEKYDTKPTFDKRLGETMELYKKLKEE
ncbi:MAG: hypothetical protein IJ285_00210 [Clostridia bacterium]|nr:hypothetical protein [Oscillospiraceae bacterium]MBQ7959626.1 hypothetical protein [Clostridia bacterium]